MMMIVLILLISTFNKLITLNLKRFRITYSMILKVRERITYSMILKVRERISNKYGYSLGFVLCHGVKVTAAKQQHSHLLMYRQSERLE